MYLIYNKTDKDTIIKKNPNFLTRLWMNFLGYRINFVHPFIFYLEKGIINVLDINIAGPIDACTPSPKMLKLTLDTCIYKSISRSIKEHSRIDIDYSNSFSYYEWCSRIDKRHLLFEKYGTNFTYVIVPFCITNRYDIKRLLRLEDLTILNEDQFIEVSALNGCDKQVLEFLKEQFQYFKRINDGDKT